MSPEQPNEDGERVDLKINPSASIDYWNSIPATEGGMLGMLAPYPWYTRIDLRGSKTFIGKVRRLIPGCPTEGKLHQAADCGAGVGRVTEGLLSQVCDVVDAVEPVAKFAQVINKSSLKSSNVVGDIYTIGLEDWNPDKKYDLMWIQFCIGHLKDHQVVETVKRCCAALTETGVIVLKENISTNPQGNDIYDDEDSSVTRTDAKFRSLFEDAGMRVIASEIQTGFPKNFNLFPVRFYALRPKT